MKQTGFTLVELLIVVVILGILAAVVIPQFRSSTEEAREAVLVSDLTVIRRIIELYKVQHDDNLPTADIVIQLTTTTSKDGFSGTTYGPYFRNGFPENPISGSAEVKTMPTMPKSPPPANQEGWIYVTTGGGEFRANVKGAGPSGTDYFAL